MILLSLLLSFASASEFVGGSLTLHTTNFDNVAENYSNKLNSSGTLIYNHLYGFREVKALPGDYYSSVIIFGGTNSVAEPIVGAAYSEGFQMDTCRLGVIGGGYAQGTTEFERRGVYSPGLKVGEYANIVPIVGVEWVQNIGLGLFTNTLLSPMLFNFGIGKRF